MQSNRAFLNYIHQFRGFAILLIVGIHALTSIPWIGSSYTKRLIFSLANNGTILFVFIAGFLFYYLSHQKFNYGIYLKKKLKYVILPYLIISIPALVDKLFFDGGSHWWMKDGFMDQPKWIQVISMLATGRHSGILWFIPMIIIFYLLSYVLIRWAKTISFNYIVPVLVMAGLWTFQFGYYSNIGLSFVHFLPVYLMGMWVAKFKDHLFRNSKVLLWSFGACYLILSLLEIINVISLNHLIELRDQNTLLMAFNSGKLKASIFCLFLILYFYKNEESQNKLLDRTGNDSFGIFFLHLYCINVFQIFFRKDFLFISGLNFFTYLLYVIAIVSLCLTGVYFVKLLFKQNSRLIIGS